VTIDACRRASARSITAVIPYFGYARADRKTHGRESIAAKLVANILTEAGASMRGICCGCLLVFAWYLRLSSCVPRSQFCICLRASPCAGQDLEQNMLRQGRQVQGVRPAPRALVDGAPLGPSAAPGRAGANRVLAMDLHSGQCVGYFDIPVDHVYGDSVILDYLASKRLPSGDLVVVSPDVGGVARARAFAKKLNDAPLVRRRLPPATRAACIDKTCGRALVFLSRATRWCSTCRTTARSFVPPFQQTGRPLPAFACWSQRERVCQPLPRHGQRSAAGRARQAIVDKRRSAHNVSEVMNVIGDVRGKVAVLVDDMIDTAGARRPRPRLPGCARGERAQHRRCRVLARAGRMHAGRRASALPRMRGRPTRQVSSRLWHHRFGCEPVSAGQSAGGDRSLRARARHDHQRGARAARGGRARGVRVRHACRLLAARRRAPQQRRLPGGGPCSPPWSVRSALCARAPGDRAGSTRRVHRFLIACACIPAWHRALAYFAHDLCSTFWCEWHCTFTQGPTAQHERQGSPSDREGTRSMDTACIQVPRAWPGRHRRPRSKTARRGRAGDCDQHRARAARALLPGAHRAERGQPAGRDHLARVQLVLGHAALLRPAHAAWAAAHSALRAQAAYLP